MGFTVNCYFSEDLDVEFAISCKIELDAHQVEVFSIISHMRHAS